MGFQHDFIAVDRPGRPVVGEAARRSFACGRCRTARASGARRSSPARVRASTAVRVAAVCAVEANAEGWFVRQRQRGDITRTHLARQAGAAILPARWQCPQRPGQSRKQQKQRKRQRYCVHQQACSQQQPGRRRHRLAAAGCLQQGDGADQHASRQQGDAAQRLFAEKGGKQHEPGDQHHEAAVARAVRLQQLECEHQQQQRGAGIQSGDLAPGEADGERAGERERAAHDAAGQGPVPERGTQPPGRGDEDDAGNPERQCVEVWCADDGDEQTQPQQLRHGAVLDNRCPRCTPSLQWPALHVLRASGANTASVRRQR
jgi:hypothetical protein